MSDTTEQALGPVAEVAEPKKKRAKKETLTISNEKSTLLSTLIKAQSEFGQIVKNHTNPFTKSKYADLSDIMSVVRPVLNANGLGLRQLVESDGDVISVESIVFNGEGESVSSGNISFTLPSGGNQFQTKGIAITYARRYTLCSLLSIVADDDLDGELKNSNTKSAAIEPALKSLAEAEASKGVEAYRSFFKTLSNEKRAQLINSGVHDELKKTLGA